MSLSEKTLKSSLESGALYPIYIIFGNDGLLKKQAVDRIIKTAVGEDDGLNLLKFESNCDLQEVFDELNGFPVMADRKCVLLTDFDIDGVGKNEYERLMTLVSDSYETSVFVVFFNNITPEIKKSDRLRTLISAAEKSGGVSAELNHRTREELGRQLSNVAKKHGCVLSVQNALYLIDTCSTETSTLINELSKLCAATNGGEITREIIDRVAVKSIEASVYDMSKKIMAGNAAEAMSLLDELFFMKVAPEIIVFDMASSFINMFRVAAAKDKGLRPEEIAVDFKMKGREFVLKRAADNLRRYDYKKLELSFEALLDADKALKSYSSGERPVLEQLIVRLIYIMKTGEAL